MVAVPAIRPKMSISSIGDRLVLFGYDDHTALPYYLIR
jgi:hypothetical protein